MTTRTSPVWRGWRPPCIATGRSAPSQLQHAGRQASLPSDGKHASNDVAVSLPWSQSHAIVYANADEKQEDGARPIDR